MAKATTVVMLLAATAAIAAAHPALGKGALGNIAITANASNPQPISTGAGTITFAHGGHEASVSKCKCRTECADKVNKVCKDVDGPEVCKNEKVEEDVEECSTKCFKADKVITIGKGRRLLSASSINTVPHIAHGIAKAAIIGGQGNDTQGQPSEICREICRPAKKSVTKKVCKPTKVEACKDEMSTKCEQKCVCAPKTIIGGIGKGK